MGILRSDWVAVAGIVGGGLVGGLGMHALLASEAHDEVDGSCGAYTVSTVAAPKVVVRIGGGDKMVVTSGTPSSSTVRFNCEDASLTADEVRVGSASIRILDLQSELADRRARMRESQRALVRERAALIRARRIEGQRGRTMEVLRERERALEAGLQALVEGVESARAPEEPPAPPEPPEPR